MTRRPSAATAIALLALLFALGGTAVAARHYLINSTSQIKPSVLKKLKGQAGAAGPAGVPGPSGPQGPPGPSNLSALTVIEGPTVEVEPGKVKGAVALCPAGSKAVSGGGFGSIAGLDASETSTGREGWFIIINNETGIILKIKAQVLCAGTGQAVAASAPSVRYARIAHQVDERVAKLTSEASSAKR